MHPENWHKIETIFYATLPLPRAEWDGFVARQCDGNTALYEQVISLLEQDEGETLEILEHSLFEIGAKVIESEDELPVGERLGSFEIKKCLGRGGMGTVYLADDLRLGRPVALKVLPSAIVENSFSISRFRREARTASNIFHPNIAHIYEFGELAGRYFIAMEYVPGRTLRQIIADGPVDPALSIDYAKQLAAALSAAHRTGAVHRDIKPENVVVSDDGLVKILDFGLAKAVSPDLSGEHDSRVSIPGLIMGTTAYMSPEQLRGDNVAESSDVWSFGIVLHEMLAGMRPFFGETQQDLKVAILTEDPAPLPKASKGVVSPLSRVIEKCLDKDPAKRYPTGKELVDDLRTLEGVGFPADGSPAPFWRRYAIAAAAVLLVVIIGAGVTYRLWGPAEKSSAADSSAANGQIKSLAILPFVNESGEESRDFLADGMSEFLINRISEIPDLTVKARSSVFHYKGRPIDVSEVARDLAVQSVLIGRIAEEGENIRLSLSLVDAATGNQVWGKQYVRNAAEVVGLQQDIARDLSKQLYDQLPPADQQKVAETFTTNHKAYNCYLTGRYHWNKRTAADLKKSIGYFESALQHDPRYVMAYSGLADSYALAPGYGFGSPKDMFPKAKSAALKALEMDGDLAEANTTLAFILFNYEWNFSESEDRFRRAIALNPNYATAYHWYGNANLLALRRFDESIEALQHAQRLDPLSLAINSDLGTSYLYAGRLDEAIAQFNQTLEMDGNFYYARVYLSRAYLLKGEYEKALAELEKIASHDDARIPMLRAHIYARMGKPVEARRQIDALKALKKKLYVSEFDFALASAALGDSDAAFAHLQKAFQERDGNLIYLDADPLMANLRNDARFFDLLMQIGLAQP